MVIFSILILFSKKNLKSNLYFLFQGEVRYETISDVRNQLRVFEEIDEVERKHRETREREILMRVAKVCLYVCFVLSYTWLFKGCT